MSGEDQVSALIDELHRTRQSLSKLTDEVARLVELFGKMLSVEPVTARRESASPFAEAAGGLIEQLVMGGRKKKGRS